MRVKLNNVGVIDECDVEFTPGITLIIGSSGSGKSTLMRSIYNMASNGFSDCDIAFNKNTMKVLIECDGNKVEYIRNLKSKGDRFYYIVNGETYSKVGRTSLQQVSDALKISNIDINGEEINFNFNLQFSTPFLILGSQSTLYNVLTYRSTFDIASINDYYKLDIKNNESEILTVTKVKERLESTLNELEGKAEQLSPIENIYSKYIQCKHDSNFIDDLLQLNEKIKFNNDIELKSSYIEQCLNSVDESIELVSELIELYKFKELHEQCKSINNKYGIISRLASSYEEAINYSQTIIDFNKLVSLLHSNLNVIDSINAIDDCIVSYNSIGISETFIADITKQLELLNKYSAYLSITNTSLEYSIDLINSLEDIIALNCKLETLESVNSSLYSIKCKECSIHSEISKFSVCPLCGGVLHNG